MTRGINAEFMSGWLREYDEERDAARASIYAQYHPDNIASKPDADAAAHLADINRKVETARRSREQIKRDADHVFVEWESALYTSGVFTQGFKTQLVDVNDLDGNGELKYRADGTVVTKKIKQEMLCPTDDPECSRFEEYAIRVPKPGAINKKVKRVLYEFVTFGDAAATNAMFDDFVDRVAKRYADEQNPMTWVEADLKIVLSGFGTIKRKFPGRSIIEDVLRKLHPDAKAEHVAASACDTIQLFEGQYFNEYLPDCIARKYPRLEIDECLISNSLPEYVKAGFVNPFKILFQ